MRQQARDPILTQEVGGNAIHFTPKRSFPQVENAELDKENRVA
jgi:hypothetical protein